MIDGYIMLRCVVFSDDVVEFFLEDDDLVI